MGALMAAPLFSQQEIIDLLIDAGANPSITDRNGNTVKKPAQMHGHNHLIERFTNA
jgi:ankyrin repeat protein